jgi:hypothetical protein
MEAASVKYFTFGNEKTPRGGTGFDFGMGSSENKNPLERGESERPGAERQGNQPKDLTSQTFEAVLSREGNHLYRRDLQRSALNLEIFRRGLAPI